MKILLIIIILIFSINTTNAQLQGQAKIDSLLKELPKMKEDTNGVKLLINIAVLTNDENSILYYNRGIDLAKKLNWTKGYTRGINFLAGHYSKKYDFINATKYYLKSLKILEESNDSLGILQNLLGIIEVKRKFKKIEDAKKYIKRAILISQNIKNEFVLGICYSSYSLIYESENKLDSAIMYALKHLEIIENESNEYARAHIYSNLGFLYLTNREFKNAEDYLKKADNIFNEVNYKSGIALSNSNFCELYLTQAKTLNSLESSTAKILKTNSILDKSITYGLVALKQHSDLNEPYFIAYASNMLHEAYVLKKDYKSALLHLKKYNEINDSTFSSSNLTKIADLEAKRENEVKEKEIEILKKEKENQKLQRYAMFGGIAGLGIIIGLILIQRRKSEKLLLNVLPSKIAKRLKAKEHPIADHFDNASIIFIDIVGFTTLSSDADPKRVVSVLNDIFTIFDKLADKHGLEKIKTIGDAYMAVAGIPEIQSDHTKRTAQMALDIKSEMKDFKTSDGTEIKFRIGIDCGAVVAGVIGEKKFIYDLWSDAVNTASRMESTGESGQIQITENFKTELEKFEVNWNFTLRGEFDIKGKGLMKTYFLED